MKKQILKLSVLVRRDKAMSAVNLFAFVVTVYHTGL